MIAPEVLYGIIAVLAVVSIVLSVIVFGYIVAMAVRKSADSKFGRPDRYVIDEVKNRITQQRREAAVDALIEELKPGEIIADE